MSKKKSVINYKYTKKISALAVILIIAAIGTSYIFSSHAQTPYASNVASSGSLNYPATPQADSSTFSGSGVQFGPSSTSGYITRQGNQLFLNGKPYHFTGINMYSANLRDNCISGYSGGYNNSVLDNDLSEFDQGTNGQSRVIRAWFFQSEATTSGAFDWSAFDHTLSVAQNHGFRVIAVLANSWGTCEAPGASDSNGIGYRDISFYQGGYKNSPDVGHTGGASEGGSTSYRQYVQDIVSRYKNNPTILAWQLMNEANAGTYSAGANGDFACPDPSAANTAILAWANDMVPLVKSLDPNHLVSIGTLDGSCGTYGSDNNTIMDVSGNDLCDYHDYSSPSTTVPSDLSSMISYCNSIDLPTMVAEIGVNLTDPSVNNNLSIRSTDFNTKFNAEFNDGVVGILPWVWNGSDQTIDNLYQIEPSDPSLGIIGKYGLQSTLLK